MNLCSAKIKKEPGPDDLTELHNNLPNDEQDEALDYSKIDVCKRPNLVPSCLAPTITGEFWKPQGLIELGYAQRKGCHEMGCIEFGQKCTEALMKDEQDVKDIKNGEIPHPENINNCQSKSKTTHEEFSPHPGLWPINHERIGSTTVKKEIGETTTLQYPPLLISEKTIMPLNISTDPLLAAQHLTNAFPQRYEMHQSGLLGNLGINGIVHSTVDKNSNENQRSSSVSSSSSDIGSPSFIRHSSFGKLYNSFSRKHNQGSDYERYCEKRRKNNEAARKCRGIRQAKEQTKALRTEFLEQENEMLKVQLALMASLIMSCDCKSHAINQLKGGVQNA